MLLRHSKLQVFISQFSFNLYLHFSTIKNTHTHTQEWVEEKTGGEKLEADHQNNMRLFEKFVLERKL